MSLLTLAASIITTSLVYLLSSIATVFIILFTLAPKMIKSSVVYFRVDFSVLLLHRREARSWATSWPSRLAVTHTLTPSMCYMQFIVQVSFMLSWWVYTSLCTTVRIPSVCTCTLYRCLCPTLIIDEHSCGYSGKGQFYCCSLRLHPVQSAYNPQYQLMVALLGMKCRPSRNHHDRQCNYHCAPTQTYYDYSS